MEKLRNLIARLAGNLFAILLGTGIALLLAEGLVRCFMPSPDYGGGKRPALYSNLFEYDARRGWKGVANISKPYYSKDFRITVSHDDNGYRNTSPAHVSGKQNYLLLGDSYAWGWGVEDRETAAAVLNGRQAQTNFYSLGVPGYGTDQAYLAMQDLLAAHPDYHYQAAILLFYLNDFENNAAAVSYEYPKAFFQQRADGTLTLQNIPVPHKTVAQDRPIDTKPVQDDPLKQSQLFNLASMGLLNLYSRWHAAPAVPEKPVTLQSWQHDQIALTAAILADMQQYCRAHQMDFHVVFLMTQNTDAVPQMMINHLAMELQRQQTGLSFFSSRTFPRTDLWLDTHYTPYGQKKLAEHISNVIAGED